jgi:uncharacterized protein YfaT (DUF1175 family)
MLCFSHVRMNGNHPALALSSQLSRTSQFPTEGAEISRTRFSNIFLFRLQQHPTQNRGETGCAGCVQCADPALRIGDGKGDTERRLTSAV